jgi:hypothetical protein
MNRERYQNATSRQEQVHITMNVVVAIRNTGGWFLRYDEDQQGWVHIDEKTARKKVAQAIQYRRRRSSRFTGVNESSEQDHFSHAMYNIEHEQRQDSNFFVVNATLAETNSTSNQSHDQSRQDSELLSDEQIYNALGISIDPQYAREIDGNDEYLEMDEESHNFDIN